MRMRNRYFHFNTRGIVHEAYGHPKCLTKSLREVFGPGLIPATVANMVKAVEGKVHFWNIVSHPEGIWWVSAEEITQLRGLGELYLSSDDPFVKVKRERRNLAAGMLLLKGLHRRGYLIN